jgi:hypothetical protein
MSGSAGDQARDPQIREFDAGGRLVGATNYLDDPGIGFL